MPSKKPGRGHEETESSGKESREERAAGKSISKGEKPTRGGPERAAGLPGGVPPQAPGQRVKNPKVL